MSPRQLPCPDETGTRLCVKRLYLLVNREILQIMPGELLQKRKALLVSSWVPRGESRTTTENHVSLACFSNYLLYNGVVPVQEGEEKAQPWEAFSGCVNSWQVLTAWLSSACQPGSL